MEQRNAVRPKGAPNGRLEEVCKADGKLNDMEAAYFNAAAKSLRLTTSQLITIAAQTGQRIKRFKVTVPESQLAENR